MPQWNRVMVSRLLVLITPVWVAGTVLIRPASAGAQAPAPVDLVGTWLKMSWRYPPLVPDSQSLYEMIWTFHTDNTWTGCRRINGVDDTTATTWAVWSPPAPGAKTGHGVKAGRWQLRSDTLEMFDSAKTLVTETVDTTKKYAPVRQRVALRGEQLLWAVPPQAADFACADRLRRVDASKPLLPPRVDAAADRAHARDAGRQMG